ncbi:MAG: hypothetical protein IBX55_02025 [Methyloprofundus sp.]|nr:hypothetical protein [Methyloprofundus sp.]
MDIDDLKTQIANILWDCNEDGIKSALRDLGFSEAEIIEVFSNCSPKDGDCLFEKILAIFTRKFYDSVRKELDKKALEECLANLLSLLQEQLEQSFTSGLNL